MTTLVQLYEEHALACVEAADLTDDPNRRCLYLKLAAEWTRGAQELQARQRMLHAGEATDLEEKGGPLFFWADPASALRAVRKL
jgi:hypothetical protein